jgi:glutathione S-transferase
MLFEYGLGSALRGDCSAVGAWLGPAWGALSLMCCAVAVVIAWPLARAGSESAPAARAWLARVAMFEAGIFMLAITFQTIATLIVPSCAR